MRPRLLKVIGIGVVLGLVSALLGAEGASTWSGTSGGIVVLMVIGAPFIIGGSVAGSMLVGVAISVVFWIAVTGSVALVLGQLRR